jgi:hypothetical protein
MLAHLQPCISSFIYVPASHEPCRIYSLQNLNPVSEKLTGRASLLQIFSRRKPIVYLDDTKHIPSMFSFTILAFLLLKTSAISLLARQDGAPSCSDYGFVDCGVNCLYPNYTCCPDEISGCLTEASYCYISSDSMYDCCDLGTVCASPDSAAASSWTGWALIGPIIDFFIIALIYR